MYRLPSEIQGEVRKFGYNPVVSDQELYHLIQELDPYYSLTDLAQRYSIWLNQWNRIGQESKDAMKFFPRFFGNSGNIIWGKDVTVDSFRDTGLNFTLDPVNNALETDDEYFLEPLIKAYELRDTCPLNPMVLCYDGDIIEYFHTAKAPKFSYMEPLNEEALNYLKTHSFMFNDITTKFSLQREYTRIQKLYELKNKPHPLDKLFNQIGDNTRYIIFNPDSIILGYDKRINLDLSGYTVTYSEPGLVYLKITCDSSIVAKLWDGISSTSGYDDYISIYPTKWTTSII